MAVAQDDPPSPRRVYRQHGRIGQFALSACQMLKSSRIDGRKGSLVLSVHVGTVPELAPCSTRWCTDEGLGDGRSEARTRDTVC